VPLVAARVACQTPGALVPARGLLLLCLCAACGDAADDTAEDAGRPEAGIGPSVDASDAETVVDSGYGDGVCTELEFREGLDVIEISRRVAGEGPAAVGAFIDQRRADYDGIWADCVERFCPIAKEITDECLAQFEDESDAGVAHGPSCYPLPEECVAILADLDAG